MARFVEEKLNITGKLMAYSPLHVGASIDDLSLDMPVAVNGLGEVYIPATSLAGALRAWWETNYGDAKKVWGHNSDSDGGASSIILRDAKIENYAGLEIRDSVGIDRKTGAAADGAKYDRQVVPCGASFDFSMQVEIQKGQDANFKACIGGLLKALSAGEIRIGAAKTRGLGKMKLTVPRIHSTSFKSLAGLIESHAKVPELLGSSLGAHETTTSKSRATFKINWTAKSSVMSAHSAEGLDVKFVPMVTKDMTNSNSVVAILPGSGIKGAIRSTAERIIRTLQGYKPGEFKASFLDQIDDLPLIEELFGSRKKAKNTDEKAPPVKAHLGQGAIYIDDCVVSVPLAKEKFEQLLTSYTKEEKDRLKAVRTLLTATKWSSSLPYQHVAIDRWTGAASDGALYSMLRPDTKGMYEIVIEVDLQRIPKTDHKAQIGFVLIILREMMLPRIPLGFGVNRGLGSIEVKSIEMNLPGGQTYNTVEGAPINFRDPSIKPYGDDWIEFVTNRLEKKSEG
jgi:CRISPR/Cas system CSM-associated protein Csm3 (group 7 of RAMP superfamily)